MSFSFWASLPLSTFDCLILITGLCALSALSHKVWSLYNIQLDPMEPPLVQPRVPFFGHIMGLMWYNHEYLAMICQRTGQPICTIPMLHRKAYVLGSPSTVQAAFRSKAISFAPFAVDFVSRMDVLSPEAKKAYAEGLHEAVIQTFSSTMSGSSLRRMNAVALQEVARLLPDPFAASADRLSNALEVQDIWSWLRSVMTISTTSSLFGEQNNPWVKDPSLVETYWGFEAGDITGRAPLTDLTDLRSQKDHAKLVAVLRDYFASRADEDSNVGLTTSALAKVQREAGYTPVGLGATYVVILHGALANMVPTMFWTVMYAFTQPRLIARLRAELAQAGIVIEATRPDGMRECRIRVGEIEKTCPLLLSALRETQRLVSIGTLHRRVLADTVIYDDAKDGEARRTYLLKKGTAMLLSIKWNHRDPEIWGPHVDEFDTNRFYRDKSRTQDPVTAQEDWRNGDADLGGDAMRQRKKAYLPFGGGKELCPGRSFATSEILGTMVLLILGYDITGADGLALKLPEYAPPKMTQTTARPHPSADLRARVRRREGWEDVFWSAHVDAPDKLDLATAEAIVK
ncbi:cytochrome P450 [Lecanosticta acicola]|uniref:Cytochrome P450 n=1 Tax=Lecanosticta acicola TaxID=111012 RepID=A0AAI8Z812_9PEZI|nr:cytochrome P450 [Lecanosticta acicola]